MNVLGSMDDNESEDEEDSDENEESEEDDDQSKTEDYNDESKPDEQDDDDDVQENKDYPQNINISVKEFLVTPSADNFLALGPDRIELLLEESKVTVIMENILFTIFEQDCSGI